MRETGEFKLAFLYRIRVGFSVENVPGFNVGKQEVIGERFDHVWFEDSEVANKVIAEHTVLVYEFEDLLLVDLTCEETADDYEYRIGVTRIARVFYRCLKHVLVLEVRAIRRHPCDQVRPIHCVRSELVYISNMFVQEKNIPGYICLFTAQYYLISAG